MVERTLSGAFWRVRNDRKPYTGALGQVLERAKLAADVGSAVAVNLASHVSGDWINGNKADAANFSDLLFELVQVLGKQKHLVSAISADALKNDDAVEIGPGGNEAGNEDTVEGI